jgi:hypothetical protein
MLHQHPVGLFAPTEQRGACSPSEPTFPPGFRARDSHGGRQRGENLRPGAAHAPGAPGHLTVLSWCSRHTGSMIQSGCLQHDPRRTHAALKTRIERCRIPGTDRLFGLFGKRFVYFNGQVRPWREDIGPTLQTRDEGYVPPHHMEKVRATGLRQMPVTQSKSRLRSHTMTSPTNPADTHHPGMLNTILNLAHYHREHELFYSRTPLEAAVRLQVASHALKALAIRWQTNGSTVSARGAPDVPTGQVSNRYSGCTDLNDPGATEALGILFMEGEGEPAEVTKLKRDLLAMADEHDRGGDWLDDAMEGSWMSVEALIGLTPLADVLGDRHRIIVNNWQMASNSRLIAKLLRRAVGLLKAVELTPPAIREDLAGPGAAPGYLLSAAELIDAAADLSTEAARRVHDSEPRWRRFRGRIRQLVDPQPCASSMPDPDDGHDARTDPAAIPAR